MNLNHDGKTFEVYLLDDGTLDTVIEVDGIEHRYSTEFASQWRDEVGAMSERGIRKLALLAIEEDERHWR